MRKSSFIKWFGVLIIIFGGLLLYSSLRSSEEKSSFLEQGATGGGTPPSSLEKEIKKEKTKTLLFRQNRQEEKSSHPGKQVVDIYSLELDGKNKKKLFTDMDEEFQVKIIDGIFQDSIYLLAADLTGISSLWEIKIDGTGKKSQIQSNFQVGSFSASQDAQKIAYVVYDNVKGSYNLMTQDKDGKFKEKILENQTALSDPLYLNKNEIAYLKVTPEGESLIEKINLENKNTSLILKSPDTQIYSLNYKNDKFAYIKAPKTEQASNKAEVYICDQDGKNEKRLTNDDQADNFPVLSNDTSYLAFYKNGKIWLYNIKEDKAMSLVEGSQPLGFIEDE